MSVLWIQNHWQGLAAYLIAASAAGFLLMGADKARAKRRRWRIPEKILFGTALLGGTPGCLAGMYLFRHKTRHPAFRFGMPLILLVQLAAAGFFCFSTLP